MLPPLTRTNALIVNQDECKSLPVWARCPDWSFVQDTPAPQEGDNKKSTLFIWGPGMRIKELNQAVNCDIFFKMIELK